MGKKGKKKILKKAQAAGKSKPLNPEIFKKVKNELINGLPKTLKRCESMDSIRFPKKILHPDDLLVRVHKRVKLGMWKSGSQPSLVEFEEYKQKHCYQDKLDIYDEREWVRGIWEAWFDEVIPQLDGTGGR